MLLERLLPCLRGRPRCAARERAFPLTESRSCVAIWLAQTVSGWFHGFGAGFLDTFALLRILGAPSPLQRIGAAQFKQRQREGGHLEERNRMSVQLSLLKPVVRYECQVSSRRWLASYSQDMQTCHRFSCIPCKWHCH